MEHLEGNFEDYVSNAWEKIATQILRIPSGCWQMQTSVTNCDRQALLQIKKKKKNDSNNEWVNRVVCTWHLNRLFLKMKAVYFHQWVAFSLSTWG